jgi:hypothetical protein
MKKLFIIIVFIIPLSSFGQTTREFTEDSPKIVREITEKKSLFPSYNVKYWMVAKDDRQLNLSKAEAYPLFALTEFAICGEKNEALAFRNIQYERLHWEHYFRCRKGDRSKQSKEITELCKPVNVRTKAQETLCKEVQSLLTASALTPGFNAPAPNPGLSQEAAKVNNSLQNNGRKIKRDSEKNLIPRAGGRDRNTPTPKFESEDLIP